MSSLIPFFLGTLATWRLASLFSGERGPFAIGEWVRSRFGVFHNAQGEPMFEESGEVKLGPVTDSPETDELLHEVAHGLTCFWCCSIWVAAILASWSKPYTGFRSWLMTVLALSTAAIGINSLLER